MIVVADTSPILNLERIGRLELLPALYGEVVIPEQVFQELTADHSFLLPTWLKIRQATDRARVMDLLLELDPGESEAIALAEEIHADLLIIDESYGRRLATEFGLKITGLVGVILEAKRRGFVDHARPILDELVGTARFWVSDELVQHALRSVDEA